MDLDKACNNFSVRICACVTRLSADAFKSVHQLIIRHINNHLNLCSFVLQRQWLQYFMDYVNSTAFSPARQTDLRVGMRFLRDLADDFRNV